MDSDDEHPTWTVRWRWPIAIGTGVLALLCFAGLFSEVGGLRWLGGVGLVLLAAWAVAFRALFRRGY